EAAAVARTLRQDVDCVLHLVERPWEVSKVFGTDCQVVVCSGVRRKTTDQSGVLLHAFVLIPVQKEEHTADAIALAFSYPVDVGDRLLAVAERSLVLAHRFRSRCHHAVGGAKIWIEVSRLGSVPPRLCVSADR